MKATIYHNPKCGTSRKTLALLEEHGADVNVIEYLKTPPSKTEMQRLFAATGLGVRGHLRKMGTPFEELGLDDEKWSDDELLDFVVEHPILMQRPIVETDIGTKLCRPQETVLEILPAKG